jgi:hypothetical protein
MEQAEKHTMQYAIAIYNIAAGRNNFKSFQSFANIIDIIRDTCPYREPAR